MKKKSQKPEIMWNIINSLLAGALVFIGACSNGEITWKGVGVAFFAAIAVAITKFRDYWLKEESQYTRLFNFVTLQ